MTYFSALMFGVVLGVGLVVAAIEWVERRRALRAAQRKALSKAAQLLRDQGGVRFRTHGPLDIRGAALWDAGCYIDPDDGGALEPNPLAQDMGGAS